MPMVVDCTVEEDMDYSEYQIDDDDMSPVYSPRVVTPPPPPVQEPVVAAKPVVQEAKIVEKVIITPQVELIKVVEKEEQAPDEVKEEAHVEQGVQQEEAEQEEAEQEEAAVEQKDVQVDGDPEPIIAEPFSAEEAAEESSENMQIDAEGETPNPKYYQVGEQSTAAHAPVAEEEPRRRTRSSLPEGESLTVLRHVHGKGMQPVAMDEWLHRAHPAASVNTAYDHNLRVEQLNRFAQVAVLAPQPADEPTSTATEHKRRGRRPRDQSSSQVAKEDGLAKQNTLANFATQKRRGKKPRTATEEELADVDAKKRKVTVSAKIPAPFEMTVFANPLCRVPSRECPIGSDIGSWIGEWLHKKNVTLQQVGLSVRSFRTRTVRLEYETENEDDEPRFYDLPLTLAPAAVKPELERPQFDTDKWSQFYRSIIDALPYKRSHGSASYQCAKVMTPAFVTRLTEEIYEMDRDCVFWDLGSGIGNIVAQVAVQVGCPSYGVELQQANHDCAKAAWKAIETYLGCQNYSDYGEVDFFCSSIEAFISGNPEKLGIDPEVCRKEDSDFEEQSQVDDAAAQAPTNGEAGVTGLHTLSGLRTLKKAEGDARSDSTTGSARLTTPSTGSSTAPTVASDRSTHSTTKRAEKAQVTMVLRPKRLYKAKGTGPGRRGKRRRPEDGAAQPRRVMIWYNNLLMDHQTNHFIMTHVLPHLPIGSCVASTARLFASRRNVGSVELFDVEDGGAAAMGAVSAKDKEDSGKPEKYEETYGASCRDPRMKKLVTMYDLSEEDVGRLENEWGGELILHVYKKIK